jgi:hypothetical protein
MVSSLQLPVITPPGAGVELFDEDDPILSPHPLVIQGPRAKSEEIFQKICHYRIWYKLEENSPSFPVISTEPVSSITDKIQGMYRHNEDDPNFIDGVGSVTLIYPKEAQSWVTQQLAGLPPRLSLVQDSSLPSSNKSIHIQGPLGTKSLAVLELPLDIEVPGNSVFMCLNNPSNPAWITALPRDRPPMEAILRPQVLNEQEVSEQAAWDRTSSWLKGRNFSVEGKPYPNGKNCFPDYRAWIDRQEYDVEITSVPDMERWTIKSTYRDLEKVISKVAKQPGETKEDVAEDLRRVLGKKRQLVENANVGTGCNPKSTT